MFELDKDSIIIDGVSMGQYLVEAKYAYNKLWASDSGRNLAGKMTGTLIGIFPKFTLQFRPLTKEELNVIAPILNKARQSFTYYDADKNKKLTITTYSGDWELTNVNMNQNKGFSCSFISTEKRA